MTAMTKLVPGSAAVTGTGFPGRTGERAVTWQLPEETAVAFDYNGRAHAVMMATPADLEDFALGFSLSEEIVAAAGDIEAIAVTTTSVGVMLDIRVAPDRLLPAAERGRAIAGRSGCGLCGIDSLVDAVRPPHRLSCPVVPEPAAIALAFADLPAHQPMNRANRSVHAAAWCDRAGRIAMAREDVGRHNALDKLIGALIRQGLKPEDGFVVMTSRCSFELVQKAAVVGIPLLATLSAPTTLALALARDAGLTLAARAPDGIVLFD